MVARFVRRLAFVYLSGLTKFSLSGLNIFAGRVFEEELRLCLNEVAGRELAPPKLIEALVEAEDHRFYLHFGVDPIALLRAVWVLFSRGRIEGGSTIEQQFVRVVTGHYERTLSRKLREQLLALSVSQHCSKAMLASAYLSVGYFGEGLIGYRDVLSRLGFDLSKGGAEHAAQIVARLKHPEPRSWNESHTRRVEMRVTHIIGRMTLPAAWYSCLNEPVAKSTSSSSIAANGH